MTDQKRDYSLYVWHRDGGKVYITLYVDDLLNAGRNLSTIKLIKKKLAAVYQMIDCYELRHFLVIQIDSNLSEGILRLLQESTMS